LSLSRDLQELYVARSGSESPLTHEGLQAPGLQALLRGVLQNETLNASLMGQGWQRDTYEVRAGVLHASVKGPGWLEERPYQELDVQHVLGAPVVGIVVTTNFLGSEEFHATRHSDAPLWQQTVGWFDGSGIVPGSVTHWTEYTVAGGAPVCINEFGLEGDALDIDVSGAATPEALKRSLYDQLQAQLTTPMA